MSTPTGVTKFTIAPQTVTSLLTVISEGHTIVGNSVSFTFTVNKQFAVFPAASVTMYFSIVVPIGNKEPDPKPKFNVVTGDEQLSVPTGVA